MNSEPTQFNDNTQANNVAFTLMLFVVVVLFPITYKIISVFNKCFDSIYELTEKIKQLKQQSMSTKNACSRLRTRLRLLESSNSSDSSDDEDVKMIEPVFLVKKCNDSAIMLKRAKKSDAGYDLYSIDEVKIDAYGQNLIGIGLCMAIPEGYYGQIQTRSSLAVDYRVTHEGGVIDSGYRGEVKVILHNMSDKPFEIEKGNKIAQLILTKIITPNVTEVLELDDTDRGAGGFGSTGRS